MVTGSIAMFAGSTAPQGWLLCDGSAVSRSTYSELFSTIGTTYGQGDGSTTFNLPDLAGRVLIGASTNYPSASTGGEENHSLTEQELPSHTHSVGTHGHGNDITATTPVFSHTVTQAEFSYATPSDKYIRKTSSGSWRVCDSRSYSTATRTTDAAISDHPSASCGMSGSVTDCGSFDTASAGSGQSHSNMQPYVALNYIIYAG